VAVDKQFFFFFKKYMLCIFFLKAYSYTKYKVVCLPLKRLFARPGIFEDNVQNILASATDHIVHAVMNVIRG
jgi:hypothetical protein